MGKELFWAQGVAGLVVIQGRSQRRRWEGSGDGGAQKGQGGKKFDGNIRCEQGKEQDCGEAGERAGTGEHQGQLKGPCSPGGGLCRLGVWI